MKTGALAVDAGPPNSGKIAASGTLVFVDNAVDSTTGTIKLRARLPIKTMHCGRPVCDREPQTL